HFGYNLLNGPQERHRYGICKQRLDQRAGQASGSPETEERQVIRTGRGCVRVLSEEAADPVRSPRTPRDRPPVWGIPGHLTRWLPRSRIYPEAVARRGL